MMTPVREQAEELTHKMSLAALEAYTSGQVCGWLYGNGANGDSYKELIAAFSAGVLRGAESAAQETSITAESLAQMMRVSRSGFYDLLKKAQIPLLSRKEGALAFAVLAALETKSTYGGADLVWLQNEFVNYEQDQHESDAAYHKRVAAEEARLKNIVERLYRQGKIEKRSRSDGGIRYCATDVIISPDNPEAFETALKTFRRIIGALTIAALEQQHWGKKNGAATRYNILRLRDDPAARVVLKKAREHLQELEAKLEELKEWYMCNEDGNAEYLVTLNLILGRVVDYADALSADGLSEISEIFHG